MGVGSFSSSQKQIADPGKSSPCRRPNRERHRVDKSSRVPVGNSPLPWSWSPVGEIPPRPRWNIEDPAGVAAVKPLGNITLQFFISTARDQLGYYTTVTKRPIGCFKPVNLAKTPSAGSVSLASLVSDHVAYRLHSCSASTYTRSVVANVAYSLRNDPTALLPLAS